MKSSALAKILSSKVLARHGLLNRDLTDGFCSALPAFYADEKALKELKETFGYGEGFLTACLAYCNNDAQQVLLLSIADDEDTMVHFLITGRCGHWMSIKQRSIASGA